MNSDEVHIFRNTKRAFIKYGVHAKRLIVNPLAQALNELSPPYDQLFSQSLKHQVNSFDAAIVHNAAFCESIASLCEVRIDEDNIDESMEESTGVMSIYDEKVVSVLRQVAREWSSDGRKERAVAYGRILYAFTQYFPQTNSRSGVKIIVPGCGLGRLPFELSLLGFNVTGNEVSTHMIMASQAILNHSLQPGQWTIWPYIHSQSHWRHRHDPLRSVKMPDVSLQVPQIGDMSMAIGDFFEMASDPEKPLLYLAVATCFFIDAPYDFFKTLDSITNLVEPGGLWINFGPLHWHSEMSRSYDDDLKAVELSLEDVISAIEYKGWKILERESAIPSTYCSTHPSRMGRMIFECEFWVAQKDI